MKKFFFLSFTILSLAFLTSCGGDASAKKGGSTQKQSSKTAKPAKANTVGSITNVDPAGFKKLIGENAGILLDVRTPREFQAGSIAGTKLNINVGARNFKAEMSKLDKDKTYLIYCRSGARSGRAAQIMESMGFKNIINLKRGYMSWKRAGF